MSTTRLLKGVLSKSQWFLNYKAPKYATLKLKTASRLKICELYLTMLGTELAHNP